MCPAVPLSRGKALPPPDGRLRMSPGIHRPRLRQEKDKIHELIYAQFARDLLLGDVSKYIFNQVPKVATGFPSAREEKEGLALGAGMGRTVPSSVPVAKASVTHGLASAPVPPATRDLPVCKGQYGPNCLLACTCQNGGICDHVDGNCTCGLGWTGRSCEKGMFVFFHVILRSLCLPPHWLCSSLSFDSGLELNFPCIDCPDVLTTSVQSS
ncbi:hypothetical protein DUI87_21106 [Hirundo rustica rustica]|uniref:EGF-like domain-containing protein n=1 Tax=Hirundo rustica rustica TaxID=333673 RepID=A0A3M0JS61_HIRRU|nr:hypothetical protein DUI87_21106 [Hirundo rustica rustica]